MRITATATSNGIAHAGHRYAMSCAAATVNPASALTERYSGMQHVNLLAKLSVQVEKNIVLDPNSRNTSNGGVKRAASPNPSEARKRSKSEENKVFQESSDWE